MKACRRMRWDSMELIKTFGSIEAGEAAIKIRRAIDAYLIRTWLDQGVRCTCGCSTRLSWEVLGDQDELFYHMTSDDVAENGCIPPEDPREFAADLRRRGAELSKSAFRLLQNVLELGDAHLRELLSFPYIARAYRGVYLQFLVAEVAFRDFQESFAIIRTWPELAGAPLEDCRSGMSGKPVGNLYNPLVRWLIRTANYMHPAVEKQLRYPFGPELVRGHMLRITRFWILRVRSRIRRWKQSRSFFHGRPISIVGSDGILGLLKRCPIYVPAAAKRFIAAIERSRDRAKRTLEKLTDSHYPLYTVPVRRRVLRWLDFLLAQRSAAANRAARLLLTCAGAEDDRWFSDSLHRILDHCATCGEGGQKRHHNRLLAERLRMMLEADVFVPWQDAFYILKKALAMPQPAYILRLLVSVWADYDDGIGSQEMNELMAAPAITAYMRRTDVSHKERTAFVEHVARTVVVEYADRLIECWRSGHPLAKTAAVREAFAALRVESAATIQTFMVQAVYRRRRFLKRMGALMAVPGRRRLFARFCGLAAEKWRSLQQQECYVCMTVGGADECGMIPLHMDMRHAICRKCRDAVLETTGECPMCRKSLCVVEDSSSYAETDTDDLTSVSYSGSEGVEGSEDAEDFDDPADYDDLDYLD